MPHSDAEQDAIWAARLSDNTHWLGIHDLDGDNVFEALDGAWDASAYTYWNSGQPDASNGNARCVYIRYQNPNRWASDSCEATRRFC